MKLRNLRKFSKSDEVSFDVPGMALCRWSPDIRAASESNNDIGIYDVIGEDYWGDGISAQRISAALRSIGHENPVTVNINSPGGDMFEGLAIYNLLQQHGGEVTVRVMGLAASAASIIAMAGDRIEIAKAGFFMIHNAWIVVAGNRNELTQYAEYLAPFDSAMSEVYADRWNIDKSEAGEMMDAETWISGSDVVTQGFADDYLPSDLVGKAKAETGRITAQKMDVALAKAGLSRSEARKLKNEFKSVTLSADGGGTPRATVTDKPSAVVLDVEPLTKITFPN